MSYRPNLFDYAPRELSHSAFWAWVLDSLNTASDDFEDVRELAGRLLREAGAPHEPEHVKVETEYTLQDGAGRVDIRLVLDRHCELLIENKVSARPSPSQMRSYEQASELEEAHFLLVSTAFPMQNVECAEQEDLWTFLQTNNLLALLEVGDLQHPILVDYHRWLRGESEAREDKMTQALSANPEERGQGLQTIPGQWAFMKKVTEPFAETGRQYGHRGRASGQPWVEFRFVESNKEPEEKIQDAVFYRVENLSGGPAFRVHQYQGTPTPNWPDKRQRLDTLRNIWFNTIDDAGQLPWSEGSNRGKQRCEIARLGLQEFGADEVAQELDSVHGVFVGKLKDDLGWDVERILPCGER